MFFHWPKASVSGAFEVLPSSFMPASESVPARSGAAPVKIAAWPGAVYVAAYG